MMSAGDLGIDPSGVESALSNIMDMSAKWNAVLLLDEADVFLEQRSAHDLERNKLVSIFLRILEYENIYLRYLSIWLTPKADTTRAFCSLPQIEWKTSTLPSSPVSISPWSTPN